MIAKLKAFWASLPPWAKTGVVIFIGGASGVIRHVFQNPNACMTEACWKGYVVSAVHGGAVALVPYLMHSPWEQASLPPANATAPQPPQK